MIRTLAVKLALAFLLVSLTVAILAAVVVRWLTTQEFKSLVLDQAQSRFVSEMAAFYMQNGSWEGVEDYLHRRLNSSVQPPLPAGQKPPQVNPRDSVQNALQSTSLVFALVDVDGVVLVPTGPYHLKDQLALESLENLAEVQVNDQVVGYVVAIGKVPEMDVREQRYLARTDQALLFSALGATAIALLLGIWLARTLTRSLGELTAAIRAMGRGQLEQRVEVRSSDEIGELAAAFNQMSADLARSNQARRQMTADIAHDLRTPLTVIAGYIEAMRDQVLLPTTERFTTIYNEVMHLQHLVEDLRTLSLADAGELRLQRQPIAPQALLERCAAAHAQLAEQKSVTLEVRLEPDLPQVVVDIERMAQVLGNLISNALRHTPAGGKVILSAEYIDGQVLLSIQDTGEGIPVDAMPHIFDRFYRVDRSRQRFQDESGLGLAIVRSLVEAHGGKIRVDSALHQGTTFTIVLTPGERT